MMKRALLLFLLLAGTPALAWQTLDAPELPNRSKKKSEGPGEVQFESKGVIEIGKPQIAICSEGAASGEALNNALEACDRAIAAKPDDGDAHYYRGFVLYHLERYADAENAFNSAIDLRADRLAESFFQRGVCKEMQRRPREAALDFKRAYDLKPEWSAARRKVDEYHWAYQ